MLRNFLCLLVTLLLLCACSIPEEFGWPSYTATYRLIFLNDHYQLDEIAEEDSSLYVQNDVLVFQDSISEQRQIGTIELEDMEDRLFDISFNQFIPGELGLSELNGVIVDSIPTFDLVPYTETLDPYAEFDTIAFSAGFIRLLVDNNLPVGLGNPAAGAPIAIEIMDYNDATLIMALMNELVIPPSQTGILEIDLTGIVLPNSIRVRLMGGSTGSQGEPALIDTSAAVDITVEMHSLSADYVVNAHVPEQTLNEIIDNLEIGIEYPDIIGDFSLNGFISLQLELRAPLPCLVNVNLYSVNDTSSEMVMLHPLEGDYDYSLVLGADQDGEIYSIDSGTHNLNEFLTVLPNIVVYEFYPVIGDTVISVFSSDIFQADFRIDAEIQLETGEEGIWMIPLDNGQPDVNSVDTGDFDQKVYDAFQCGKIRFSYLNFTGLEMNADVMVSLQQESLETEVYEFENPDSENVQIFNISGLEITPDSLRKEMEIVIDQSDLMFFLADSVYTASRFRLFSTGQHPLSGGVGLIGEISLEILVNQDLLEDEE